ncbi:helix-turn-helix transcriptional regulator [Serratia ficaria]|uniref:AraC family transcriptional regulator n=1 Tax=Serratia TaxID=613 RepID=UPI00077C6E3F|nr:MULTISPECIES: helix-turn-helix transcriptional regulator [Serratia]MEE4482621.1 helix-turn-helix transcriptional regulator [Serratia ficaria]CAI0957792.1 HTH-type transcriptional repressor of iron proteins A [Serratia ficaria]CAI1659828.1 HTH-type transcriptional repressor of iron proteins A [Serratia ficaria]CAI1818807.1 HTH-type transcriptional repressor of iron proteins A [Serratia ficaria]CAI2067922.1 HTH-type transcriptional repressor of iron proteins A [Serratia ficaria]
MTVQITRPRFDIDRVPRAIFAVQSSTIDQDWEVAPHRHQKAQLIYTVRGMIRCEVENGLWLVPPQCALWMPGNVLHNAQGAGSTEAYCLFVDPRAAAHLPQNCCTLAVSPLLRELLLQTSTFDPFYDEQGPEGRLTAVLLDQLAAAPIENLHLPVSDDARIRQLTEGMLSCPADKSTLRQWAQRIGMSERSLSRTLQQQMGMSFGHWRRQLHVMLALQRLTRGESVQTVALDLGYESASGFVTMFRKAVGKPPARYLAERSASGQAADGAITM